MRLGDRAGVSLVEILTGLALVAIAVAISVPTIANVQRKKAARTAADSFVELHARARASAIKYGRLVELHIDAAGSRLWLQADTAGSGTPDTLGAVRDFSRSYVQVSSNNAVVCFDARGTAAGRGSCAASQSVIVFQAGQLTDTVRITAAGSILR